MPVVFLLININIVIIVIQNEKNFDGDLEQGIFNVIDHLRSIESFNYDNISKTSENFKTVL